MYTCKLSTMADIHIFNHPQYGTLRAFAGENREAYYCAIDVARALDYREPSRAVRDFCKDPIVIPSPTPGGTQLTKYIKAEDVDRLVGRSGNPESAALLNWVLDTVYCALFDTGVPKQEESDTEENSNGLSEDQEILFNLYARYCRLQDMNDILRARNRRLQHEVDEYRKLRRICRFVIIPSVRLHH